MKIEHTPEPWHVKCEKFEKHYHNPNAWPRLFSGDFEICGAEGFYSESLKQDKANARRIVACVNALSHVSTEELESGKLQSLVQRVADAEKQRDILLEALKELLIDVKISQNNMRDAEKTDGRWEGCADAIQLRVDSAQAALDFVNNVI